MLLDYVLPRLVDVPKIIIIRNGRYLLIAPTILKGVQVTANIIPNLKKMTFVDHDLQKFP